MTEDDMASWATDLHHKYGICWPVDMGPDEDDDEAFEHLTTENY